MLLTDSDPALFVSELHDGKKQKNFKFFFLLLFEGTFTSFFKRQQKSRFLLFLHDDGKNPEPSPDPGQGRQISRFFLLFLHDDGKDPEPSPDPGPRQQISRFFTIFS